MFAIVGYGGDPPLGPARENDLLLRADAELHEAAAEVERLVRADCEWFLGATDQRSRRRKPITWAAHRVLALLAVASVAIAQPVRDYHRSYAR
jgi:hypothetical protein